MRSRMDDRTLDILCFLRSYYRNNSAHYDMTIWQMTVWIWRYDDKVCVKHNDYRIKTMLHGAICELFTAFHSTTAQLR